MIKKKSAMRAGLILLMFLGLVIVGVGAYYIGFNSSEESKEVPSPDKDCGFNGEKCIENNSNIQLDVEQKQPVLEETEDSPTESFKNQPGAIKSIKKDGSDKWVLSIDLLTRNPDWIPGAQNSGPFFFNQNQKIRELTLDSSTKISNCTSQNNNYASNFENNLQGFVKYAEKTTKENNFGFTEYFDISGTKITTIYEQCLP